MRRPINGINTHINIYVKCKNFKINSEEIFTDAHVNVPRFSNELKASHFSRKIFYLFYKI